MNPQAEAKGQDKKYRYDIPHTVLKLTSGRNWYKKCIKKKYSQQSNLSNQEIYLNILFFFKE